MRACPPGKMTRIAAQRGSATCCYCGCAIPKGSPCTVETVFTRGSAPERRRSCAACAPYVAPFWRSMGKGCDESQLGPLFSAYVKVQKDLRKVASK